MCFHSRAEFDKFVASMSRMRKKGVAEKQHAKSAEKYGLIVLRDAKGEWVAGWHCNPRDPQDVANTIQDLKSWHAGEFKYVDMSDVDKERARLKLAPLDQDGLPLPDRAPRESVDKLVEEWDLNNKTSISMEGLKAIKRVVTSRREQEQRDAEVAQLAQELGVTPEEIRARQASLVR